MLSKCMYLPHVWQTYLPNPVYSLQFFVFVLAAHIYTTYEELLVSERFSNLLKNTIGRILN